jgi:hypothetical protein
LLLSAPLRHGSFLLLLLKASVSIEFFRVRR